MSPGKTTAAEAAAVAVASGRERMYPHGMSTEWIAGSIMFPHDVTRERDAPYEPEALVWVDADGSLLGATAFGRGEIDAAIAESFSVTTRAPKQGEPRVPARVRVASPELAKSLRAAVGSATEIVCAPTPELDEVRASFVEYMKDAGRAPSTYLTAGITEPAMARLFRAAARLHRAQPWRVLPSDEAPLAVTIPELGVEGGRLSVIGRMGTSFGVLLFRDEATFERYVEASERIASGEVDEPELPPHVALSFAGRADAEPALVREIEERGWEIAGPTAYPVLDAVDDEGLAGPPTAHETAKLEAIALALAELVESTPDLRMILEREDGLAREIVVETPGGRATVTISAEARKNPYADRPFDIHEDLAPDGEIDDERAFDFEEELVRQFSVAEEGAALGRDARWARSLLEHARRYHGVTVTELSPDLVDEVVFVDIPRQVSCEANVAPAIVATLRAFFGFLGRAFGLREVAACADVLGEGAETRLRKRLSDPKSFGMAKSFVMAGREAGFDMTTDAGLSAWMRAASCKLPSAPARARSKPDPAKKNKRKAQRASRRKNRR